VDRGVKCQNEANLEVGKEKGVQSGKKPTDQNEQRKSDGKEMVVTGTMMLSFLP
jgi:hypothetical protein